jgi:NAD(P)-dependent dehydrogenase (short-subunit alcohol dehydrogenase family)
MLAGRTEEALANTAEEVNAEYRVLDARDFKAVEKSVEETVETYGRIDGLVNAAGSMLLKPAHLTTQQEFDDTIVTNLTTAFAVVRAGAKHMRREGGSIVLFSTVAARAGLANHEAIAAAKGGVQALGLSASASYASYGIRVNVIAPGLVDSPLSARIVNNERSRKTSEAMHPLGRIGATSDIAAMAEFLLDPSNSWITGQVFGVDGGLSTLRTRVSS